MEARSKKPLRRSAAEWSRLVNTWEKSGRTAADFAAAHGIKPRTLSWWKWQLGRRLGRGATEAAKAPEVLRLVPLQLEPALVHPEATPAWEVVGTHGHVLRVYERLTPAELAAVLQTMRTAEEHR